MIVNRPIITSLLDNDLYTFTVGQLIFYYFPDVNVSYEFINRSKTSFPDGFDIELKNQVQLLSNLHLTDNEQAWLNTIPYFKKDYIDWLSKYKFNTNDISIEQTLGELKISIHGKLKNTIMWEVPILSLVSELFYKLTNQKKDFDWENRILTKAKNLSESNCKWIDFGTRRRFDLDTQESVVRIMKDFNGFLGTSNCYLAFKYNVKPNGTMSHQFPMVMSALFGVKNANKMSLKYWKDFYQNELLVFLPDTFGTDIFLRDFDYDTSNVWSGLRQDSGDPNDWMDNKIIPHYKKLGLSLTDKKIIFSDNLTDEKFKQLSLKYKTIATIIGGIGTNLSNDCGPKPISIVIKVINCNGISVVKLSDEAGKHTGNIEAIQNAKRELGIV